MGEGNYMNAIVTVIFNNVDTIEQYEGELCIILYDVNQNESAEKWWLILYRGKWALTKWGQDKMAVVLRTIFST